MPTPKQSNQLALDSPPAVSVVDEPIERMWINHTIGGTISVSRGRLVISLMDEFPEQGYAMLRKKIGRLFCVEQDEPTWGWRRGNNKFETMQKAGMLPKGMPTQRWWIWHYLDPKAAL